MPESALAAVAVDYRVPMAAMAALLVRLTAETVPEAREIAPAEQRKTAIETGIAAQKQGMRQGVLTLGQPTPYACPDCHGVLLAVADGDLIRYRCHTGHAHSADSLHAQVLQVVAKGLTDQQIADKIFTSRRTVETHRQSLLEKPIPATPRPWSSTPWSRAGCSPKEKSSGPVEPAGARPGQ